VCACVCMYVCMCMGGRDELYQKIGLLVQQAVHCMRVVCMRVRVYVCMHTCVYGGCDCIYEIRLV
jgi:hypothetical protein